MASVEKDAKERAKRRRESRVLADGNCWSLHFNSKDDSSWKEPMKVCVLMREDIGCPAGWVHDGPAVREPDQAEILGGPSFVLTNMQ